MIMCIGRTLQKRGKTENILQSVKQIFFQGGWGGVYWVYQEHNVTNMHLIAPDQNDHLLTQHGVWFLYDGLIESGFMFLQHCVD